MSFKAMVCHACQKDIQVPTDVGSPRCPYCGEIVQLDEPAPAATLATLLGMARTAAAGNNHVEALNYFNRVLEADPRNVEAWLGKGRAAAWQSTGAEIRLQELLIAFNHAISASNRDPFVVNEAIEDANKIAVALYSFYRNNMLQTIILDTAWAAYLQKILVVILVLEDVSTWDPTHRVTLENVVYLCKDNIEGIKFRTPGTNVSKTWTLSPTYEATIRGHLETATKRLRDLDPAYNAPTISKQRPDDCFVVTATIGDRNHPEVITIRRLRDEWLAHRWWGPYFISRYYRHGPKAAALIARSGLARTISYQLIVRPLGWISRRVLASKQV